MRWNLFRLRQSLTPTRRTRSQKPPWRPELEGLEDRTVPTTVLSLSGPQTLIAGTNVNVSQSSDALEYAMQVAINPVNPLQIAGFSHDVGEDMGVFWSWDGGTSWNRTVIGRSVDGLVRGGRFGPSLMFDADGHLFIAYVFYDGFDASNSSTLVTARSDDGGQTFYQTRFPHSAENTVTNDVSVPGLLMGSLTTGLDPSSGRQAIYIAYTRTLDFGSQEINVIGSNDGGMSWTAPRRIDDVDNNQGTFASPAVGPNGELYVVWREYYDFIEEMRIKLDRDLDGLWQTGHNFGDDVVITDLIADRRFADGNGPSIDVSRSSRFFGRVYVAYADYSGDDIDVYLVRSDNKGSTWFLEGTANGRGNVGTTEDVEFKATVAVDQTSGSVNVGYYHQGSDGLDVRVASSINGGASWTRTSLSSQSSPSIMSLDGYVGLAAHDGTVRGFWEDNRGTDDTDAYTATASFYSQTGGNKLIVIGDSEADSIDIKHSLVNSDYVEVFVNGKYEYTGLWATLNAIEVYGLGGDDVISIRHGALSGLPVPVSVFGGIGKDAIYIDLPVDDVGQPGLGQLGKSINVDGGPGSDTVTLRNDSNPTGFTYSVTNSAVNVAGSTFGGLSYTSIEGLTLNANSGNDTFNISSTASGVPVTVNAGDGNDTTNMGSVRPYSEWDDFIGQPNLGALKSGVIVNGEEGTDTVNLNDQSATANDAYTISSFAVQRKHTNGKGQVFLTGLTYSAIEDLHLNAGKGNSSFKITSTASGTPVTVDAGAGHDTIHVGDPLLTKGANPLPRGNLDLLRGPITVNGQSGTDVVQVMDQGAGLGHHYLISDSGLRRVVFPKSETAPLFGGLSHDTLERLTLNSDNGNNLIMVSAATLPVTINGNGGSDTLVGPATDNTWLITAPNQGTVGAITFDSVENLRGGGGADVFAFRNSVGTNTRISSIDGDGGTNWLDYSRYLGTVAVNLTTGNATGVDRGQAWAIQNVIGARTAVNVLVGNDDPLGNILVGGNAADEISGGLARGILIGGRGKDLITAGPTDDILIGGYTDYDLDRATLQAIMGEWLSTDNDYQTRMAAIREFSLIWGTDVHDDSPVDQLRGDPFDSQTTDLDWFFANLDAGTLDRIFDLQVDEKVNNQP